MQQCINATMQSINGTMQSINGTMYQYTNENGAQDIGKLLH